MDLKEMVWTGFIWFRVQYSGGILWTLHWTFGFSKRQEISHHLSYYQLLMNGSAQSSYIHWTHHEQNLSSNLLLKLYFWQIDLFSSFLPVTLAQVHTIMHRVQ
jgi:hypothetical protein